MSITAQDRFVTKHILRAISSDEIYLFVVLVTVVFKTKDFCLARKYKTEWLLV